MPTVRRRLLALTFLVWCLPASRGLPQGSCDPRLFDSVFVGWDASNYNTARYLYASCTADLDNDGDPDLATAHWPSIPKVTVLLNHGDGTFSAPALYGLSKPSQEIIAADLTGDGFADLVASLTGSNGDGSAVAVLVNRGDGTFQNARTFACGKGPVGLAAGDFDGDGWSDVVTADHGYNGQGNTLSLLANDGAGGLLPPIPYNVGNRPFRVAAADLDGDGFVDLAAALGNVLQQGPLEVRILFNDRLGGFAPPVRLTGLYTSVAFGATVHPADLDGDGDVDLVYGDAGLRAGSSINDLYGVAVFRNPGTGTFGAPEAYVLGPYTGSAIALGAAELTGDGRVDLVGALGSNGGWVLLPGNAAGGFGPVQRIIGGETPYDVEIADVDGDGDLDPIVADRDSMQLSVMTNPGDGTFVRAADFPVEPFAPSFDHGDIDNDGDLDVVAAGAALFKILKNRGDGTFDITTWYPGFQPLDTVLADLEGDGDLDLVWNESGPPYSFCTALNDGTGRFYDATRWNSFTCGYTAELGAFDLDGDG
ncbi:MAG TPA: VCBS repeat-containing protein, partial [Candidatus Polarisedimenticolia bacterium]|nr:VCBS repeat-containing protein [Candidatus Polarisedimenticolia bacterium]